MLQQSICSSLPIVKTSHSTIPYDHLLKERMGANCCSAVVILFSCKFGHQSSYLHRNSRIMVFRISESNQLFHVWIGYINDNYYTQS